MRVSWLIPFHNAKPWLREAVDSVLSECTDDDEVILVDDGSNDAGAKVLPSDSRIKLIRQEWGGIVSALERGRLACKGEYIARLDADDIVLPGRIEAQLSALNSDINLGLIGGRAKLISQLDANNQGMAIYVDWVNRQLDPLPQRLVESPMFHPAVTMRATAINNIGGYRSGAFPEDYDLWLRFVEAGYQIRNLDREVVSIRDHKGRLTRTDNRYSKASFTHLKLQHMDRYIAPTPRRIAIMGAGKGARPWIRWARSAGHELSLIMDIKPGGVRGSTPVVAVDELAHAELDLLIVTVGARGVRDQIRSQIHRLRPDLIEGKGWFAVA